MSLKFGDRSRQESLMRRSVPRTESLKPRESKRTEEAVELVGRVRSLGEGRWETTSDARILCVY